MKFLKECDIFHGIKLCYFYFVIHFRRNWNKNSNKALYDDIKCIIFVTRIRFNINIRDADMQFEYKSITRGRTVVNIPLLLLVDNGIEYKKIIIFLGIVEFL